MLLAKHRHLQERLALQTVTHHEKSASTFIKTKAQSINDWKCACRRYVSTKQCGWHFWLDFWWDSDRYHNATKSFSEGWADVSAKFLSFSTNLLKEHILTWEGGRKNKTKIDQDPKEYSEPRLYCPSEPNRYRRRVNGNRQYFNSLVLFFIFATITVNFKWEWSLLRLDVWVWEQALRKSV